MDGGCPKSGEAGVEGEDQKESAGREWGRGAEKKIINKIKWDWDGQKEPRGSGSLVTRRSRKKHVAKANSGTRNRMDPHDAEFGFGVGMET